MTALIGAVIEAFSELRIHKTRVLLALLGVMLSVAALTSVVALGNMASAGMVQTSERMGGRAATLGVSTPSAGSDQAAVVAAYAEVVDRYSIEYSSLRVDTFLGIRTPAGRIDAMGLLIEPDYGTMRRMNVVDGRWFTDGDTERLAPVMIVNEAFHTLMGSPDITTDPGVELLGERDVKAVIVGILADDYSGAQPQAYLLKDQTDRWELAGVQGAPPTLEAWVPAGLADELTARITADLKAQFGPDVSVYRQDYAAQGDPYGGLTLVIGGVAGLVLLLGAVGLLNISMVTVKYRVREIGIRRSFGATSGRIFFGVMMESVVATSVAGVAGVMLAVAVVSHPRVQPMLAAGATDLPPFPIGAALLGVGSAIAVGALAGLIPALVAVRVKVIDAIRY
ncbi:ABC transporter permease [Arthrobacter crusticola]|uniref:ABC transporter permease n=1 Tax=Arthrobacter crusticola TaxID=2547960 RepID=A0A4R5TTE3_9MICC|nr:ABC transporter permease [Arthrobacter crusticola]TDK23586.1 ABC transporter permease [Arthrobacter crusticola]